MKTRRLARPHGAESSEEGYGTTDIWYIFVLIFNMTNLYNELFSTNITSSQ